MVSGSDQVWRLDGVFGGTINIKYSSLLGVGGYIGLAFTVAVSVHIH